jgi:integrase/recombinase XerD
LRDLRASTRSTYVSQAVMIGRHYEADPAALHEEEVRTFFLFLRNERRYAGSSLIIARAALRYFYCDHLGIGLHWKVWQEMRVRRVQTLPVVFSREEVARLLRVVRCDRFRTIFEFMYGCGLRISEALQTEVKDIDGQALRVHVRDAKGGKDRYVPIAPALVATRRRFWRRHRHTRWLFPALPAGWRNSQKSLPEIARAARGPMGGATVQSAFRLAVAASGLRKKATPHTLRHSYATHLLEEGVSIRLISQFLGHTSLETTLVYTHLTAVSEGQALAALQRLAQQTAPRPPQPARRV